MFESRETSTRRNRKFQTHTNPKKIETQNPSKAPKIHRPPPRTIPRPPDRRKQQENTHTSGCDLKRPRPIANTRQRSPIFGDGTTGPGPGPPPGTSTA